MDLLQNTRDLVVRLDERFADMEKRVERNSKILEELRDLQTGARATWNIGKALVGAGKIAATIAGSSGVLWFLEHAPKSS